MTDFPILMSGPMVRAYQREIEAPGTGKTQTRRLAWKTSPFDKFMKPGTLRHYHDGREPEWVKPTIWQKVRPGDRLWVRETFVVECDREYLSLSKPPTDRPVKSVNGDPEWGEYHLIPHYCATEPEPHIVPADRENEWDDRTRWTSPIHMPRWASRLTLLVTETRTERLQEISEADAVAEGCPGQGGQVGGPVDPPEYDWITPREEFATVWEDLHGPDAWDANPEVVVITATPHACNIDRMEP